MNEREKTIVLIFTLGLLVGLLGGYNLGYMQGKQNERNTIEPKLMELENNYKLLLLLEKISTVQKLETIVIKQISDIAQNYTVDLNLTRNITLEATVLAKDSSNIADNVNCPGSIGILLKTKTTTLTNLTEKMTFYLDRQDYLNMVNTYQDIILVIKDIAEIIDTC
jgi:hypothetical protein